MRVRVCVLTAGVGSRLGCGVCVNTDPCPCILAPSGLLSKLFLTHQSVHAGNVSRLLTDRLQRGVRHILAARPAQDQNRAGRSTAGPGLGALMWPRG